MSLAEKYIALCKSVRISFKNCGYDLRPRAGAGLWLIPLIPTALLLGTVKQILRGEEKLSHVYFATTVVSCGLLFTTILYVMRFLPRGHRIGNHYFAFPAIGTLLFLLITQNVYSNNSHEYNRENAWFRKSCGLSRSAHILSGWMLSLLGGVISTYGVLAGLPTLLTLAPSCFTIGEAVIVVHSLIIFLYSSVINICHVAFSQASLLSEMDVSYEVATVTLQIGMMAVLLMLVLLRISPVLREPSIFYVVVMTAALSTVLILHILLGGSPVLWIFVMLTRDHVTFSTFVWWFIFFIAGAYFVYRQVQKIGKKATTSQRKIFHILAVLVFSSGIIWAPDILYLASGVCFAVFLVLETARILCIPPLSDVLRNGFILYGDEKDTLLSLTPLYLLAGLSAPLWLTPLDDIPIAPSQLLPYMSGVLSIGIGDTAASYVGSKFGRRKWPGTNRTKEGTIACFLSQVFFVIVGVYFNFLPGDFLSLVRAFGAIAIISFIEAKTSQVDNVVLPLILYILTY